MFDRVHTLLKQFLTVSCFPLSLFPDLCVEHFATHVLAEVDNRPKASEQDNSYSESHYCLWNFFVLSLLLDLIQYISEHNIAEHPQQRSLRPKRLELILHFDLICVQSVSSRSPRHVMDIAYRVGNEDVHTGRSHNDELDVSFQDVDDCAVKRSSHCKAPHGRCEYKQKHFIII